MDLQGHESEETINTLKMMEASFKRFEEHYEVFEYHFFYDEDLYSFFLGNKKHAVEIVFIESTRKFNVHQIAPSRFFKKDYVKEFSSWEEAKNKMLELLNVNEDVK